MSREPILIVGGGLGGLTAALALARRGRRTRVLEGASEFGAIGYGIQFGPNVFHVFDRLGLTEQVMAVADSPPAVLMLDALSGKELVRIATGGAAFRARFKHPYIIVHRIDVHNVLLDACRQNDAIELVADAMVSGYEDRGDGVAVTTADGRTFSGAALVAADGVRSLFRAKLIGDGEPRPIGYVALRTIVPMQELKADVPRDCVVLWSGPGLHIVHYPLRHGGEFNIVNVYRTAAHAERLDAAAARAELEHAYRDTQPSMRCADRHDGPALAPLDRRPRSGAALARGPHRALGRRRARAVAIAGPGCRHGDRRRPLPCRGDSRRGRRLPGRISPFPGGAASPHRAGAARIPFAVGFLSPRRRHRL